MLPSLSFSLCALVGPPATEPEQGSEARVEALEQDNAELKRRLDALEQAEAAEADQTRAEAAEHQAAAEKLETENEELREEVGELRERLDETEARMDEADERLDRQEFLTARLRGYLDVGFFWAGGNGAGTRPDLGGETLHVSGVPDEWVFMGDPLSTMINSRGDLADTGDSQAIDFDPIRSNGKPTLIVNTLNIAPSIGLGERLLVAGMVDFLPRGQTVAPYGETAVRDYVDIKLAYVRWIPDTKGFGLRLYAGKVDSVVGREYRYQEAPDRLMVTPSLSCRYTCGRPIGLKSRWSFLPQRNLVLNVSLTNGGTHQHVFGTASDREHNLGKTGAGRVSYEFDVGTGLEIGVSGLVGSQDLQPSTATLQWQYGIDAYFGINGFEAEAAFFQVQMQGRDRPGQKCGAEQCLAAMTAYGQLGYRVTNWFMPVFRTDWRDAVHRLGGAYHYESHVVRFSPGVRFEVGEHVIVKGEYNFNVELGRIPRFPNDVLTTSLVARF